MRTLLSLLVLALSLPAWAAPSDPWTVDAARSRIAFRVEQLGKIVSGRIAAWTGTIVLDPQDLRAARIDIRMDMQSATAGTKDIDDMMRGPNFFDAARQPEARFVSSDVISRGGDNYQARGKLTIREVTRDITLPFSLRIQNGLATARGTIDIKRLDYGIGRNEWASTNYVADTVTIELTVVASRP